MTKKLWGTLALLVATATAGAAQEAWKGAEAVAEGRGKANAFLVVVTKAESDLEKNVKGLLENKKLEKLIVGLTVLSFEPGDENNSKKAGIPVEKNDCLFALDGYGIVIARSDKSPQLDAITKMLKSAQDSTARKRKQEKSFEGMLAKGEAAMKKDDAHSACEAYQGIVAFKETIPCSAIETAEKKIDELTTKGKNILAEADAAMSKNDYGKATKLISQVAADYPIPAVQEEVKRSRENLNNRMRMQRGR